MIMPTMPWELRHVFSQASLLERKQRFNSQLLFSEASLLEKKTKFNSQYLVSLKQACLREQVYYLFRIMITTGNKFINYSENKLIGNVKTNSVNKKLHQTRIVDVGGVNKHEYAPRKCFKTF